MGLRNSATTHLPLRGKGLEGNIRCSRVCGEIRFHMTEVREGMHRFPSSSFRAEAFFRKQVHVSRA